MIVGVKVLTATPILIYQSAETAVSAAACDGERVEWLFPACDPSLPMPAASVSLPRSLV